MVSHFPETSLVRTSDLAFELDLGLRTGTEAAIRRQGTATDAEERKGRDQQCDQVEARGW